MLPVSSFRDPVWDSIDDKLWPAVAKSLNTSRLARQVSYMCIYIKAELSCHDIKLYLLMPSAEVFLKCP